MLILGTFLFLVAQVSGDYSLGPNGDGIQSGIPKVEGKENIHRVMLGEWIAQWDTLYNDWFYYNIKTDSSTWLKPAELEHVVFKPPTTEDYKNQNEIAIASQKPVSTRDLQQTVQSVQAVQEEPDERFFQSETDEFFGFDTSPFSRSFIQENGVAKAFTTSLTGIYDNIVKDYVTSVFSTAIENYVLATIQIVGWFLVGSFIIISGAFINQGRSFPEAGFGRGYGDNGVIDLNLPFVQGVNMSYPYDISMLTCYKGRDSCIKRDLGGEVDHLADNISSMKNFFYNWLELGEKIGHAGIEGDYEDLVDFSSNDIGTMDF